MWVNVGSGKGLLPDGTKSLPEPMSTDHQWSPVTSILGVNMYTTWHFIEDSYAAILFPFYANEFSVQNRYHGKYQAKTRPIF